MTSNRLLEIEDRLFTARRLRFYGSGAVAAILLSIFLWWGVYRGTWVVRPDGSLSSIDFCWIWVSGHFAASSDPSRIYDHIVYSAAQDIFFRPGECLFLHQYVYPPTFLFLTYPLAFMPYAIAFTMWVMVTLFLYLVAIYAIIPRSTALIAALTSFAVLKNLQLGHTGFAIAALIGLSLVFTERRPWLSGFFLGLLTCKPQYGVLFPLALLASRNWRALGSGTAMSMIFGIAAAFVFGYEGWLSFIDTLLDRNEGLSPDGQVELGLQSVYGLLHWAGAPTWISWTAHSCVAAAVALGVCAIWAKPFPHSLKAATLCIGAVMFTPYVLVYDLCILSVAAAFLVSDGTARGFLPGERATLLICWAGLSRFAVPIGPVICTVLLFLCIRRVAAYSKEHLAASRDTPIGLVTTGNPG
jgi:hypothetical protein